MSNGHSKALPPVSAPLSEGDGFGRPGSPDLQNPDAPATAPPDQHEGNQPERTLSRKPKRRRDRDKALLQDALEADRELRRKYCAYWKADPKGLRAVLKKARARAFRLKPGPKQDAQKNARIAEAASKRARGATWEQLYLDYLDAQMSEYTRYYAEAGFQKEVNRYLRKHPRLRRKFSKKTVTTKCPP